MVTWYAISGSWRTVDGAVEKQVRADVRGIMESFNGIVTGGALGVDYIATDEALQHDECASRLVVILPTSLRLYEDHFRRRAKEGVIANHQADSLIHQLRAVKERNPSALREMTATECNESSYYARNTEVIAAASVLLAYQVNGSQGVQDAIDKARMLGREVVHKRYTI